MVAFDSVGPSAAGSGGASPRSFTHTTIAASTVVVVGASLDGVATGVSVTCTIGGVSATSLGQAAANGGTTGIVQAWYLTGVAAGAHTIVVTCATAADVECGSMAYSGAIKAGPAVTAQSSVTGTTASVAVTSNTPGNMIAGFVACGDAVNSTTQTSRWVNNFEGAAGQATGNAAGADAAAAGSTVVMSWGINLSPWACIAVEVQGPSQLAVVPQPVLPPGWFPGSDRVIAQPGGVPFALEPGTTDATPGVTILPTPEAAAPPLPLLPPGWFPGADRVITQPGGIPFYAQPLPETPPDAVVFPVPETAGIADWLPLPPGYFPGSQSVTVDPGGIPFWSQPQPLTAPIPPPPPPAITGQSGGTFGWFTDQYGTPRMHWSDEAWGLPANAGRWNGGNWRADYDAYHAARAAQGLTGNICHPWGHTHTGCNNDLGHTWDGVFPFLVNGTAADLTGQAGTITLNEPFWTRIDYMFAAASNVGMTVYLDLTMSNDMPTGVGHGFTNGVFQNAATTQIQAACQAIATRYKNTPNLVWFFGDDYYNDDDTNFNAARAGIAAADSRVTSCTAIEYYPTGNTSRYDLSGAPGGETPHAWGNTYATFSFVYYYGQTYFGVEYAYTEPSPVAGPVIWGDGLFIGTGDDGPDDVRTMRFMVWWALASGARGCTMGDETAVQWPSTGLAHITASSWHANSAQKVRAYFESLPGWYKLIPDTSNQLVTSGRGTRGVYQATNWFSNTATDTYVAASRTPDGSLAVLYGSQGMSVTINQLLLGAGYTATWVDPANTTTQPAGSGPSFASSGLGNNSKGDPDWVLVLQGPPISPAATEYPVIPLPPGWFPGADVVTAQPGGVPFWVQPQPTDQNAAPPAGGGAVTANAGLATGTGAALNPVPAIGVNAALATGTGAAQSPAPAIGVNAALATGTGTAQSPVPAIGVNATLATGAGAAQNATASTSTGITHVNSVSISGSGTTTAVATIPTGTGINAGDLIIVSANCNGTHATNGMSVKDNVNNTNFTTILEQDLSASSTRWLQTFFYVTPLSIADGSTITLTAYSGSGAAGLAVDVFRGASGTISNAAVGASPAAGTTCACPALAGAPAAGNLVLSLVSFSQNTATLTVAAPFTAGSKLLGTIPAVATGYVLSADGSSTYGVTWTNDSSQSNAGETVAFAVAAGFSAAAGLATGTGTAQNPAAAIGVNAALATGTGTAQSPAAAIAVTAGLASGAGTAQPPVPAIGVNAGLPSGTGTAQSPAVAIGVTVTLATGVGAALNATASTSGGVTSPALETSAFGAFPQIPAGSVISSVTVVINQWASSAAMGAPTFELHDGSGTLIGSATGVTSVSPDHEDQATFGGVTYAQLGGLRVRAYASQGSASSGDILQVGWVSLVVAFTPAGNAAVTPAVLAAAAGFGQCAVSTGETAAPATLAATAGFPQCTAGLLAASAAPATLAVTTGFGQCAVSTGDTIPPATLAVTAGFPQAAVLLAAAVTPATLAVTAGFGQCAVATSSTVTPATLAVTAGFPAAAVLLAAAAQAAALTATAGFGQAAVSTASTLTPATLAAAAAVPACLITALSTGPDYAGAAGVLAGGSGAWVNTPGAVGPPDPADASWAVP